MRGAHHPLHPRTRMALADVRAAGGKAIVLLNRRGWSNFLSCRGCGHVWMCPNCEVALVLHRAAGQSPATTAATAGAAPSRCEECGSVAVARHGAGTEQRRAGVPRSVRRRASGVPARRGRGAGKGRLARTLAAFEAAPAGVLVGTQMVAKGHDFAGVGARRRARRRPDAPLPGLPRRGADVRADHAARRARRPRLRIPARPARVLVQTLAPDAESLAFAARHDSDGFLARRARRGARCSATRRTGR